MIQKDKEISSIEKKCDVLENQLFEKDKEIDILKNDISNLNKVTSNQNEKIAAQNNDFEKYRHELRQSEQKTDEYLNNYEQYQRRNNIRITGIAEEMFPNIVVRNIRDNEGNTSQTEKAADDNSGDQLAETYAMKATEHNSKPENKHVKQIPENAEQTTNILVKIINKHIPGINLTTTDIDISHRLGKKNDNKSRPIIARFSSRLVKDKIMRNRKLFPKSVSIMDDLTSENYEALQSIKYKKPDTVQAAWYRNGRIFMKDHYEQIRHVPFKDFTFWTKLPWLGKQQKISKKH